MSQPDPDPQGGPTKSDRHPYDGLMGFFKGRVLPFDTDAVRRYAGLAVTAKTSRRGFPMPDGSIAAIAASRGFIVTSRDTAPYEATSASVINPREA